MTLPDALDRRLTDELAALPRSAPVAPAPLDGAAEPAGSSEPSAPAPAPRQRRLPNAAAVKRRARDTALHQLNRVIHRIGRTGAARDVVQGMLAERTGEVLAAVARLEERLSVLSAQVATVTADQGQSVADRINFSLMQNDVTAISGRVDEVLAEMREQEQRLLELGMAFAPGAGLAGAAVRFAELREQINSVERRLRHAPAAAALDAPAAAAPAPAIEAGAAPARGADVASELFNYVAFERRFRGDPETIIGMQNERYRDLLTAHSPVVDVGCGRAELLESLQSQGVACIGVDTDSGMVAEARARGLDVRHTDVVSFLESCDDHSLGSVFSAHLAEHLELDVLIRFLELSARKLRPGGVFVAETPNPASLIVLGNSYILDPTHVRPLHPSLLAFLCETAGFRHVRLEFYSPATSYQLEAIRDADGPDWLSTLNANSDRLNEVLFGPQEYAVIATTPE